MENENKLQSRKKFIGLGISAAALLQPLDFSYQEKNKKIQHGKNADTGW